AFVNIKVDSLGRANYDIVPGKDEIQTPEKTSTDENFSFELKNYTIKNSRISYSDESSKIQFLLTDFNHKGKGDLSENLSTLDTETESRISFRMDNTEYLSNHKIILDAVFELDLENQKYRFLENEAKINEL